MLKNSWLKVLGGCFLFLFVLSGCGEVEKAKLSLSEAELVQSELQKEDSQSVDLIQEKEATRDLNSAVHANLEAVEVRDFSGFRDKLGMIENGPRTAQKVALTFDADMTPKMLKDLKDGKVQSWYEKSIIETLEKNSVSATLFITGMWAEAYPEVVKGFAANPLLEIANHSYDHASFKNPCYGLPETDDPEMEISKTQEILEKLTGRTPKFFRFPGGCYSEEGIALAHKLGVEVVGWDVVSGDAYLKDEQKIEKLTVENTTNGSIIVLHLHGGPHASKTAAALPGIISGLQKKGFQFVTLSELLKNQSAE